MSDTPRDPIASLPTRFAEPPGGITVASWSSPVVAAVSPPAALAGVRPVASLSWSSAEAEQGASSLLTLALPAGSPGVGSTGSIVLVVVGQGPVPVAVASDGWSYLANTVSSVGILASPVGAVVGGTTRFTVERWGGPGPYAVRAMYSNDAEEGSLSVTIRIAGPRA